MTNFIIIKIFDSFRGVVSFDVAFRGRGFNCSLRQRKMYGKDFFFSRHFVKMIQFNINIYFLLVNFNRHGHL